jgi:hypothetical protein
MADRISFGLKDANDAPLTGAVPAFVQYRDLIGNARTPPAIVEIGGGQYGFSPTDADELARVVFLIDAGPSSDPRYLSGAIHTPALPFLGFHLEDGAGALWAGGNPTVGVWRDFAGNARTPPSVLTPGATAYLFALVPSTEDLAVDVAYRIDVPAGAEPPGYAGSVERQPWSAPSPGPLKSAAADVTAFLDTKTAGDVVLVKGTNLFEGQMRAIDRTTAPAVFALETGGPAPDFYLGGRRTSLFQPTVQVMIRGPAGDDTRGEAFAKAIYAWLHMRVVSGYVSWDARDSGPVYLGQDPQQHGQWVVNLVCRYRASLG